MTLQWRRQFASAKQAIRELGEGLASSPAGKKLTIDMEESNVLSKLMYPCCLAPYSAKQVEDLDKLRAQVLKSILKLPVTTSTALMYLPRNHLGFQMKSMVPEYARKAAESLVLALEDKGHLGALTRALTAVQLQSKQPRRGEGFTMAQPDARWAAHTQMR